MEICEQYCSESQEKPDLDLLILELRQRIKALHFPAPIVPRTDSFFLSKFIRTKNYKIESALDSVQRYYANVYRNLSYIKGIRPSQFATAFLSESIILLKNSYQGHRVAIFRVRNWRPKEVSLRELQLASVFVAEQYITQVDIQENGVIVIFDMGGLAFEHLRKLNLRELRRITLTAQEGLPVRVAGVHFLNPPPLFWSVYHVATRFFTEKIRKRIQLHYNNESLHKFLDKSMLPESVGGDLDEEEAQEKHVLFELIEKDIPYEEYWNGGIGKPVKIERKLSRKRSSLGGLVCSH